MRRRRCPCRRGCAGCCTDGLTVFAVEADHIRKIRRLPFHQKLKKDNRAALSKLPISSMSRGCSSGASETRAGGPVAC